MKWNQRQFIGSLDLFSRLYPQLWSYLGCFLGVASVSSALRWREGCHRSIQPSCQCFCHGRSCRKRPSHFHKRMAICDRWASLAHLRLRRIRIYFAECLGSDFDGRFQGNKFSLWRKALKPTEDLCLRHHQKNQLWLIWHFLKIGDAILESVGKAHHVHS